MKQLMTVAKINRYAPLFVGTGKKNIHEPVVRSETVGIRTRPV